VAESKWISVVYDFLEVFELPRANAWEFEIISKITLFTDTVRTPYNGFFLIDKFFIFL